MQTIYIAGSMASAERLKVEAKRLERLGYKVISAWFDEDIYATREMKATRDVYNVLEADVVIFDTLTPSTSGGRSVELGLVLNGQITGHPKRLALIGKPDNIFFELVRERYTSWDAFYLLEACCKGWELDDET